MSRTEYDGENWWEAYAPPRGVTGASKYVITDLENCMHDFIPMVVANSFG